MDTTKSRTVDDERKKRELRLRIGRMRRQIDRRVGSVENRARELLSWRTYVERLPTYAVLAALGSGLALSAGLSGKSWKRRIGAGLVRETLCRLAERLTRECSRHWADWTSRAGNPEHACAEAAGGSKP